MAGRGGVDHDEVGGLDPLERLDLAQHQDVAHAGDRGGDDVERPDRRSRQRDAPQPVLLEVLE